jgi:Protein of unknown function (DUF4231)
MDAPSADEGWVDPTWTRLEGQIEGYERRAAEAQRAYRRLKVIEVVLAALIPFLAGFQDNLAAVLPIALHLLPAVLIALLGVAVVVLEGLLHLNQYHQLGLSCRSTCAALEREKFLFLADAGPYGAIEDKRAHLAERVEELISSEHTGGASIGSRRSRTRPSY